ncbi:MAG TPA: TadA family conjugal transfer-associated ATPase [Microbacteriaceae bacterium]|nr:TadA family conjugal transfer-associated ATPase [Microbacteriaceae bacterium]
MASIIPFLPRGALAAADAPRRRGAAEFGLLAPIVADPKVTDVFVNGGQVWADRGGGPQREPALSLGPDDARALAVRLIGLAGRHVDESSPCVDARLGDGMRVHVVLPPVAPHGPLVSIRLPAVAPWSLDALHAAGFLPGRTRARIAALVAERRNVLISGAAGTGKTTLLSAMLGLAPPAERIVVIEDVGEIRVDHPHVVSLETRQANLEGAGAIGLARLVREALRMRPDRLVLGECRGEEIRELLTALNTGHDGGAGTIHANSLADVPARLEALGALAGLGPGAVGRLAASALDAVVHVERGPAGRRVAEIGRPGLDRSGRLVIEGTAA